MLASQTRVHRSRFHGPVAATIMSILLAWNQSILAQTSQSAPDPIWKNPPTRFVPPLTPELRDYVRNRPPLEGKIQIQPDGSVQAIIGGKPSTLVMGVFTMATGSEEKGFYDTYQKAHINLALEFMNLGFYYAEDGYVKPLQQMKPFWIGRNSYDSQDLEVNLWRPLRANPDAQLLLWLNIGPYPAWMNEHPDEIIRNEAGVPMIVTTHFHHFGNAPQRIANKEAERFTPSFFSETWLADCQTMVTEFIRHAESSDAGHAIAGYVLGGGQDAQLYPWNPPDAIIANDPQQRGDYSAPAIRAWHKWLRENYRDHLPTLCAAWKTEVRSFDAADAPSAASLCGAPGFLDPTTQQQQIDWNRFQADGRARFITALTRTIRQASSRRTLIGVSGGESGCRRDLSATMPLLNDPNIDILFHQATYNTRISPTFGGLNAVTDSHALHQKIFFADMDHPTWLHRPTVSEKVATGISAGDVMRGRAQDIGQLQSMWRRELGRLLATGSGAAMHRLLGAWGYEDESIISELASLQEIASAAPPPSAAEPLAQTAVIFDEQSLHYLRGSLPELHSRWANGFWNELNASGVPYRIYYAEDLAAGRVPPAKLYIFTNLLNLNGPLQAAIQNLKKQNATLVFLQGTGYAQKGAEMDQVSSVVGMRLQPLNAAAAAAGPTSSAPSVLLDAFKSGQPLDADPQVGLAVSDPAAAMMAHYPGGAKVAAALVDHGHYRSVFVGGFHLARGTIHALASYAGAWCLTDPGCIATMHPNLLMLHPLTTGTWTVNLPAPQKLTALPPETLSSPTSLQHRLSLEAGKTYLFSTLCSREALPPGAVEDKRPKVTRISRVLKSNSATLQPASTSP